MKVYSKKLIPINRDIQKDLLLDGIDFVVKRMIEFATRTHQEIDYNTIEIRTYVKQKHGEILIDGNVGMIPKEGGE